MFPFVLLGKYVPSNSSQLLGQDGFHSRLSPPEDRKGAHNVNNHVYKCSSLWSEPSAHFWTAAKALLLTTPAGILPSQGWPQEDLTSFKDAIPEEHKNNLDTAQVGTWISLTPLPEGTWRTLSCSSQPDSLWDTKLRCVPWVRDSLPVTPGQHRRLRWEHGDTCTISLAQGLLPNPLRGSHSGR